MTSIRTIGFKEFQNKLKDLPAKINTRLDSYCYDAAKEWSGLAKRSAPKDQGALIRGIDAVKISDAHYEVISPAAHSRFIEWGTKKKKMVPADLQSYEATIPYQRTGDYYDFLNAILDWVKRKGIGRTYNIQTRRKNMQSKDEFLMIAESIALSIMRHGVSPQPFFFPHKTPVTNKLIDKSQKYLNTQQ